MVQARESVTSEVARLPGTLLQLLEWSHFSEELVSVDGSTAMLAQHVRSKPVGHQVAVGAILAHVRHVVVIMLQKLMHSERCAGATATRLALACLRAPRNRL